MYGVPPPRLLSYVQGTTKVQAVEDQLRSREQIAKLLKENLDAARQRMKRQADFNRTECSLETGDWVYLRLQPCRQASVAMRRSLKLSPRFYGPFQILQKIGEVAYKLDLPLESRIHPVFHVSNLKRKLGQHVNLETALPGVTEEGLIKATQEAILARHPKRQDKAAVEILVQWQRASEEDATWEDYNRLQSCFPDMNLEDKVLLRGNQ